VFIIDSMTAEKGLFPGFSRWEIRLTNVVVVFIIAFTIVPVVSSFLTEMVVTIDKILCMICCRGSYL
jgi:hypothetical protein